MKMKKNINKKTILIFVLLMTIAFYLYKFSSLENIQNHLDILVNLVNSNFIWASLIFFILYAIVIISNLPIATVLILSAGYLFGTIWGSVLVIFASTLGAYSTYFIVKYLLTDNFQNRIRNFIDKKFNLSNREMTFRDLLLLRLIPIFPFFKLSNILPVFLNIKMKDYILSTFLGIIPGVLIFVNAGKQLAEIDNTKDLLSEDVVFNFTLILVILIIARFYKQFLFKYYKKDI